VVKAEQELSELSYQMDEMSARLEEADGMTSAQVCRPILDSLPVIVIIIVVIIILKFIARQSHTKSSAVARETTNSCLIIRQLFVAFIK